MDSGSTYFVAITIMMALGRFAAYAINPIATEATKPAKASGLVTASRVQFALQGLTLIHGFLNANFGPSAHKSAWNPVVKFLRVMSISSFVILGMFVFSNALDDTAWSSPSDQAVASGIWKTIVTTLLCFIALVFANAVFETISIYVVRWHTRPFSDLSRINTREVLKSLTMAPVGLVVIYLCFMSTMNASFSAILTIRGAVAGYPIINDLGMFREIQVRILLNETLPRLLNPINEGTSIVVGNATLLHFCFLPLVPVILLATALIVGAVLDLIDLTSGNSLSRQISRRKGSHQIVFTAALILAVIGGALAVLVSP